MRPELSPVSGGLDADETSAKEIALKSAARGTDPSKQPPSDVRRLFQDDVFERAARRPLVALG